MPAGGPGDEPLNDILQWRRPVYSLAVDSLIAELAELWSGVSLETFLRDQRILWMKRSQSELARAEAQLTAKRDELYRSAETSGWDMASTDERINAQREAVAVAWSQERSGWKPGNSFQHAATEVDSKASDRRDASPLDSDCDLLIIGSELTEREYRRIARWRSWSC